MLENETLKKMVSDTDYQVFVCETPASIPFNLGMHAFFVCNEPGKPLERWEILFNVMSKHSERWGHLYKNILAPFATISEFFAFLRRDPNKIVHLRGVVDGEVAHEMIAKIRTSKDAYQFRNNYFLLPGPNSNTYAQWILDQFPEVDITLSWRAFGKGYRVWRK